MHKFKENFKKLKVYIYIKKKQFDAFREMKAMLTEENIILHVDFAESCWNDQ